nr:WW Rsp5 WWP and PDZ and FERM central domain containing protein [Haemonchus contortus]
MIKSRSLNFPCSQTQRISCSGSVDEIRALIHTTRSSHWEPPWASWRCRLGLPYGWEQARDDAGNVYYIDHINRTTTYNDPRDTAAPEGPRTVKLQRRPEIGYGFVAAGQHPTIIQFVSTEGPSDGLLFANDQILAVNGQDVRHESKDNVVTLVRSATDVLELTVEQLPSRPRSSARRSCRVRFTDRVLVASMPDATPDFPPPLPNALRVYLENGQTRSFRYDDSTTVKDVINSIVSKLQLRAKQHFALAVEYSLGARSSRVSLLRPEMKISTIVGMPNSDHIRCVFRFAFIPKNIEALWTEDPRALDYYYQQCTADVVRGRYAFEMRYEACVRLAALHMQQVAIESNLLKENNTVSLTRLECEYGLHSFLPSILLENVKRREIHKHVRYYLRRDSVKLAEGLLKQGRRCDEQSFLLLRVSDASVSLRVRYLDLLSHLPSFGGRGFSVTFKESQIDMIMQIDPHIGLLVRHPGKTGRPTISIDYDLIDRLVVRRDSEISSLISIRLKSSPDQGLEFLVDKDDIDDLVGYIRGYHFLHCDRQLDCDFDESLPPQIQPPTDPPPYSAVHKVIPCGWNYSSDITSSDQSFDLTSEPPPYELANSFAEPLAEKTTVSPSPKSDMSRSPPPSRRNSDVAKKLLKATDSLLTKNCQKLQKKEICSPFVPRSARLLDSVSDSSDADDSSWSSPIRSPFIDSAIRKMMNGTNSRPSDGSVFDSGRRESIETLMSNVNSQQPPNLETLILFYQDSNGVKNDKNGSAKITQVAQVVKENGASATISQGVDRNIVAPMASIEEEMSISQITAAS